MKRNPTPKCSLRKVAQWPFVRSSLLVVFQGLIINGVQSQAPIKYDVFFQPPIDNLTVTLPKPFGFSAIALPGSVQVKGPDPAGQVRGNATPFPGSPIVNAGLT